MVTLCNIAIHTPIKCNTGSRPSPDCQQRLPTIHFQKTGLSLYFYSIPFPSLSRPPPCNPDTRAQLPIRNDHEMQSGECYA